VPEVLKEGLGADLVDRTLGAIIPAAASGLAAPAVVRAASNDDEARRAEAAIEDIQRTGTQSKPWAKS
jgi:hypothetical protein